MRAATRKAGWYKARDLPIPQQVIDYWMRINARLEKRKQWAVELEKARASALDEAIYNDGELDWDEAWRETQRIKAMPVELTHAGPNREQRRKVIANIQREAARYRRRQAPLNVEEAEEGVQPCGQSDCPEE